MPGQVKAIIDKIIQERSKGNSTIASTTKTKLLIKGIDPDTWTATSPDDQATISKIKAIAEDFGIKI